MTEKPFQLENPKEHILVDGEGVLFIWHKELKKWVSSAGLFFDHSVISKWFEDSFIYVKDLLDKDFIPNGINISKTLGMEIGEFKAYFEAVYGMFYKRIEAVKGVEDIVEDDEGFSKIIQG